MTTAITAPLAPVRSRGKWIAWGLFVQAIGVAIPLVVAFERAKHDGVTGSITRATVRLIWNEIAHNHRDVALIVLGVVVFVAGSVVLARPFTRRRHTLLVTVPLAALVGFAVLGVIALLLAIVIVLADGNFDLTGSAGSTSSPSQGEDNEDKDEKPVTFHDAVRGKDARGAGDRDR